MYSLNEEGMLVHAKIFQVPPPTIMGELPKPGVIEIGAIGQLKNTAQLPFAFHHVALMPDGHQGYGMPIGGILATDNVIVPHAVGVN
jgi:tRNA-splicing ligase RtcB